MASLFSSVTGEESFSKKMNLKENDKIWFKIIVIAIDIYRDPSVSIIVYLYSYLHFGE